MMDLDEEAGQIYCGVHTSLGLSAGMNSRVFVLEVEMKISTVITGFMVNMEIDSKNGSLAGQALDMILKLVAPEIRHKPWNCYKYYANYLEERGIENHLFCYKDSRFGCLSRASAVALFNYEHIDSFLQMNPHLNNRLACLVRELLDLPYLKVVYVVFAALGIQLVEPFYARTISTKATHSSLKIFYKGLYDSMEKPATEDFFTFEKPQLDGISDNLFTDIKKSYGLSVVEVVKDLAADHMDECINLANFLLPEMREVLARQRRDYAIDETKYPAQYPVESQASNIDDTPTDNIQMERLCGSVDYRRKKLQKLEAVSRSLILGKSRELRKEKSEDG